MANNNFKAFVVENESKMGVKTINIDSLDKGNVIVKVLLVVLTLKMVLR